MERSTGTPAALIALALLLVGCSVGMSAGPNSSAAQAGKSGVVAASSIASAGVRPSLPPGFPAFPGALPAPVADDDPDLIAAWTSDQLGSAAYDFYVDALPAAGYPIEGLYPGGDFAIIRFRLAAGAIWQIVIGGLVGDPTTIEVRLDRP